MDLLRFGACWRHHSVGSLLQLPLGGTFSTFSTQTNGFSLLIPGLEPHLLQLPHPGHLPVFRDYILCAGALLAEGLHLKVSTALMPSRSQKTLQKLAGSSEHLPIHAHFPLHGSMFCEPPEPGFYSVHSQLGQAVVIVIGRAHEALYAIPGEHCLTLRNRKGFVRLALRHRASLVPVYSFAENDIFRVKAFAPDSWQHLFQITFKKLEGISPCIFWGRGLFSNKSWGLVPLARPITTVVGRPIPVPQCPQPPEEQVDRYHVLYMKAVEQLLEEHRRAAASRLLLASPSPWPHPSPPPGPPSP
ncbi:hypothetical protein MJT46_017995 [Ovis ammon polii x Ovis aries]|nr:hypothetical protein MJT46_017995 [Ovis ammon polii x Ovis aries]